MTGEPQPSAAPEPEPSPSPSTAEARDVSPVEALENQALEARVIEAIRTCYDPEIPVNIYDLGLIYGVDVGAGGKVDIKMTLTSPMCPVAESLPPSVAATVKAIDDVSDATVELVWEPAWTPDLMSEAAKLQLNL